MSSDFNKMGHTANHLALNNEALHLHICSLKIKYDGVASETWDGTLAALTNQSQTGICHITNWFRCETWCGRAFLSQNRLFCVRGFLLKHKR